MAKKKKIKLGLFGAVFMLVGLAGAVFAVVGLFVSWFAHDLAIDVVYVGLFEDVNEVFGELGDFPIALVQAFAIAAAVLAVISALVNACKAFGVVKLGFLVKLLIAALTAVCGVLAIVFAGSFIANLNVLGNISLAFCVFFTGIGAVASAGALLLQ